MHPADWAQLRQSSTELLPTQPSPSGVSCLVCSDPCMLQHCKVSASAELFTCQPVRHLPSLILSGITRMVCLIPACCSAARSAHPRSCPGRVSHRAPAGRQRSVDPAKRSAISTQCRPHQVSATWTGILQIIWEWKGASYGFTALIVPERQQRPVGAAHRAAIPAQRG